MAEQYPNSTSVPTITVVNPNAPEGRRELHINATDAEMWRAKGYLLPGESVPATPEPARRVDPSKTPEPRKPEAPRPA